MKESRSLEAFVSAGSLQSKKPRGQEGEQRLLGRGWHHPLFLSLHHHLQKKPTITLCKYIWGRQSPRRRGQWTQVPQVQQPWLIFSMELCRDTSVSGKGMESHLWKLRSKQKLQDSKGHVGHEWWKTHHNPERAGSIRHGNMKATQVTQFREWATQLSLNFPEAF